MGINIEFEVTVRQVVTKTEEGKEPVVEAKALAQSTAGPEETAVILEALAERVRGAKKKLGVGIVLDAVNKALSAENAKRAAAGRPSVVDELREFNKSNAKPAGK